MSNWHAKEAYGRKKYLNVSFHIPMPNGEMHSKAGPTGTDIMRLRTAIVQNRTHYNKPITTVYNHQTDFPSEYTDLENAVLYEHNETFQFRNANAAKEVKAAALDARYNELTNVNHKDSVVKKIRQELRMWGYHQDVA